MSENESKKTSSFEDAIKASKAHDPNKDGGATFRSDDVVGPSDDAVDALEKAVKLPIQDRLILIGLLVAETLTDTHSPTINYSLSPQTGENAGKFVGVTMTIDENYHNAIERFAEVIAQHNGGKSHAAQGTGRSGFGDAVAGIVNRIREGVSKNGQPN
jgi:hypothetical protein